MFQQYIFNNVLDSTFDNIFALAIAAIILFITIYQLVFYSKILFKKHNLIDNQFDKPISVIICAKNEYRNLEKNLISILEQDYPEYEVLVVNDNSIDNSEFLLNDFKEKFPHLNILKIGENINSFYGKKFPLSLGIKTAKYENILLTDADCYLESNQWIRNMSSGFLKEKSSIVLGYGAYEYKKGFLNSIIRYESMQTATQYMGFASIGLPYMGVGRNLAYTKTLFFDNNGFVSHYNIASGDDDLFINQVANKKNCNYIINKEATTFSIPKTNWLDWFNQRKRHFTTSNLYKTKHKLLLSFNYLIQYIFWGGLISFIIITNNFILAATLFLIRVSFLLFITKKAQKTFNERKLLLISPIIELFTLIIYPILSFSNLFSNNNKWN